jgi:hypothetical protein
MFVELDSCEEVEDSKILSHPKLSVKVVYYQGRPYTIQAMQQCAYFWQAVGEEVGVMHQCQKYQEGGFTGVIYCAEHLDYIKRREAGQKERSAKEVLKNIEVNFDEIF